MDKKIFNPEKYGMVTCSCCNGRGYIQNPKRQCCPKCGGFGLVRKETEKDANTSTNSDELPRIAQGLLPEIVDRQISIINKIPFRNRYLDIQLRFSYIPLIQKPRLYLPILSYHRLI